MIDDAVRDETVGTELRRPCAFVKSGGGQCAATAMQGYDFCYSHRADLAEERSRVMKDRNAARVADLEPQRPALEAWAVREREDKECRRRENRLAWISHHERMAELHRDLAADHEGKAFALQEGRG